ncbi:signal recognition particle subunit [Raphidocelis subcapitata]|uniref:Signal recognition particle subunit SRP72 n=1 Tax=Raphidocelis subcapitata TaxID=307507 RepID=A0A2V0PJB3_9CHLO|nr:signal recognition particle subunit [Raphidocelis subcapitata]|eukprot:GBF97135.1 signal recognition particle subunit [Raphidocelis subcapitata]
MAQQDKEAELASLFDKLDSLTEHGQHAKALKVIEQILKVSPGDEDALRCKVVALISEGDFEEAQKALGHKRLEGQMAFERAYVLYRLGRLQDALKAASLAAAAADGGGGGADRRAEALQLEAQLHYRLGNAAECVAAYDRLVSEFKADSLELKTNAIAAYVAGGLSSRVPGLMASLKVTPKASFEVAFNRACGLVAEGDLAGAETALRVALKQGEEALYEEDLAEEEILDELSPLSCQLAWVLGRLGRASEAVARLEPLVGGELSDPATAAVVANNFIVDGHAADPNQKGFYGRSIKRLDALLDRASADPLSLSAGLNTRLSAPQRRALHLNRALLYLQSGKAEAARDLAAQLSKAWPDCQEVAMLQAVLLARGGKAPEADKLLAGLASGAADAQSATAAQLLRAQIALEGGDVPGALGVLGGLTGELATAPGVLATRVALMEQTGDTAGAEALLDSALAHWQSAARADPRDEAASEAVGWCLQRLVALKLQLEKAGEAIALFLQQQQQQQAGGGGAGGRRGASSAGRAPGAADAVALARLARAAAAAGDAEAVSVLARQLPGGVEAAGAGLDPEALEDLTRALNSVRAARRREAEAEAEAAAAEGADGAAAKRRRGGGEGGGAKKKRKKKPRYPKGYDPSKPNGGLPPPDPERWLPKWQRADHKKKQKRAPRRERGEGPVKGSQGAGKVDDALDRTGKKAGEAMEVDKGKGAAAGGAARPNLPQRKGSRK